MNRNRLAVVLFAAVSLVGGAPARAADVLADKIRGLIDAPEYQEARWGVLVVEAFSGRTVFARDPDRLFTPASTTKLFSCAAALCELGPDYRFETPVHYRGELAGGTLRGDLILVASGDLTFGGRSADDRTVVFANHDHTYAGNGAADTLLTDTNPTAGLDDLAAQIARAGVKEVRGDVLVDDRLFDRATGSGSGPTLVSPILVNDNVLDVQISAGPNAGDPAAVRVRPGTAFVQLDVDVITWAPGRTAQVTVRASGNNRYHITGGVPAGSRPQVRIIPVEDPARFARTLFIEALRRAGVRVHADLFRQDRADLPPVGGYAADRRLAFFRSPPLSEAVKVTLKVSHNLYASTLPLLVAAHTSDRTLEAGLRRQGRLLRELGVPVETISFAGGAGGAPADAVTPRAVVRLLDAMGKRPEATAFFNGLPVLGVDGTLADAVGKDSPACGKAAAKTGTLTWHDYMNGRSLLRSKALAGVLETAKGTRLYFAAFVNDVPLPPAVGSSREGKALGKLCEILHAYGP